MSYSYYVGCDLGQAQDFTALCVVEQQVWAQEAWAATRVLPSVTGWVSPSTLVPAQLAELRTLNRRAGRASEPPLHVTWLERLPLGTSYPAVVARIAQLLATPPLASAPVALVVDATGCGRPVVDMMRVQGLAPVAVTITAGSATVYEPEDGSYRTPKRDLVATVSVLLEQRRLQVAAALPEAATLKRELETFRRRITPDGADAYSSWRESDHDDVVLAVALALWYRQWWNVHLDRYDAQRARQTAVADE